MITVLELDNIARARIEDAKALLAAGRFDAAAYLCGYGVEAAPKARICRTINWTEFPGTAGEFQAYRTFQTHNLEILLKLSGQEGQVKRDAFDEWIVASAWTVESRYNPVGTTQESEAAAMIVAAERIVTIL